MKRLARRQWISILLISSVLLAGCASEPKVDWNSRIGIFTYDQAVLDLGPPAGVTQLDDGTRVAEWFLGRGPQFSVGFGTGFHGGAAGVGVGQSVTSPAPGKYLRLVFGPEGRLAKWERIKR